MASAHKFIANYTIARGKLYVNHVTTIGPDGKLLGIEPFGGELAYTHYVEGLLCLVGDDCNLAQELMQLQPDATMRDLVTLIAPLTITEPTAKVHAWEVQCEQGWCHRLK